MCECVCVCEVCVCGVSVCECVSVCGVCLCVCMCGVCVCVPFQSFKLLNIKLVSTKFSSKIFFTITEGGGCSTGLFQYTQ